MGRYIDPNEQMVYDDLRTVFDFYKTVTTNVKKIEWIKLNFPYT